MKRVRQNLFPIRRLKIFGMGPQILKRFYSSTIESILTGCITAWYFNCPVSDRKAQQRVVRTFQYITGAKLPTIQDLYTRRCQRKALKIVKDSSHFKHRLFCKRYQSAVLVQEVQLLPQSHKTPEHLIKWLPRLFALSPPPLFSHRCYSLLLSSMHSHFSNSTYMYILLQLL